MDCNDNELDAVLIVARFRPMGSAREAEGGAWAYVLARDWGPMALGAQGWEKAKQTCQAKVATHHGAAVEDALSHLLSAASQAGIDQRLTVLSAMLSSGGVSGARVAMLTVGYRREQGSGAKALGAARALFKGLAFVAEPLGEQEISMIDVDAMKRGISQESALWESAQIAVFAPEPGCVGAGPDDSRRL